MNYYYDVLLNLKRNTLDSFYEWDKDDDIKHFKKIPLIRVDSKTLNEFINYKINLTKTFLAEIYNKGIEYDNNELKLVPYVFIISDAKSSLACKYDPKNKELLRSNCLLNDDLNIIEIAYSLKAKKIEYFKKEKYKIDYTLRQEKEIRNILIKQINLFLENQRVNILKYLYYEIFNQNCDDLEKIAKDLKNDMKVNFNAKYLELYDLIVLFNKKNV